MAGARARQFFPLQDSHGDRVHLRDILREETVGGMTMLVAAIMAVIWANVAPHSYENATEFHIGPLSTAHWASDGLLTLFFFVAGLELKRELTEGALRRPRRAALPVAAAICGMIVPAACYLGVQFLFPHGDTAGWAIPVATDIAFALAILAIAGSSIPDNLRSFLLTLAIVDDLGAILIIAIGFTETINWLPLLGAAALCLVWWLLQRRHLTQWWIYAPLAVATWGLTLVSGVHATIAGVALGLLTYCSAHDDYDVLDRWEHAIRPWSAGVAVPVFALLCAGVHVQRDDLIAIVTSPICIGIVFALVIGKPVGVLLGTFGAAKATNAHPRSGVTWRDIAAAAQLAGIGFTVALLLAELSFPADMHAQGEAKAAVLTGSVLSALIGALLVARRSSKHRIHNERVAAEAEQAA